MPDYTTASAAPQAAAPRKPMTDSMKPMDDEDVRSTVLKMVEEAEDFIDSYVSPDREEATKLYQGQPFGNEEEGQSQVVLTDLRDVVTGLLPSIMREFWGAEYKVEFQPFGPEDVPQAEQETDYVNEVVIAGDNPGFLNFYAWFKDAFIRTLGIVKWWWDESKTVTGYSLSGLTEQDLAMLLTEAGVTLTGKVERSDIDSQSGQMQVVYDVEVTRTTKDGRARFETVPPEEFVWTPEARSLDDADVVVHRTLKTTSQLIAMGIEEKTIEAHSGTSGWSNDNVEAIARNPLLADAGRDGSKSELSEGGPALDRHDYFEAYAYLDADGDGIAELRKVCLLGRDRYVVTNVAVPERPFALLVPDPEPHTVLGLSLADYVKDIQKISSSILRAILNSLAASVHPRYEVVEDKVVMADVLNHQIGAPIRVDEPNVVRPITLPFVGADALPVLELMRGIRDQRVGQIPADIDPKALQSSGHLAVEASVTAAGLRVELFARLFAETGVKALMKGLRRLVIAHQPKARMVRLRGQYVQVDPRVWESDRDVRVNVALGMGSVEDKLRVLGVVAQLQEKWLDKLGPSNPLVGLGQHRATLARILKLSGYPNADEFFNPLPPDWQPPPSPEPPPDPALLIAQAEAQKAQAQVEQIQAKMQADAARAQQAMSMKERELELKQREILMTADLERDKLNAEIQLKTWELELKHKVDLNEQALKQELETDKATAKTALDIAKMHAARAPAPVSVTLQPHAKRRRITTTRDERGNLVADVQDMVDGAGE